jgi:uncharacterized protein with NRDE domain
MCVLAFAWNAHPRWRLVMAGNRDELHARPTAPLARWETPDHLIAGRDLLAGGTWLGVSEQGRFAVVTNLRGYGMPQSDRASRGALVTDLLAGTGRYADPGKADLPAFNPFNLIVADHDRAQFLTNCPEPIRTTLATGVYGLSNGALDEPWPKTMQIKAALLDWLVRDAERPEHLFETLRSETLPAFGRTPNQPSDIPHEPRQSPIFIRNPVYGTRCSTVVAIDAAGQGLIIERRFGVDGEATGETMLNFAFPR